MSTLSLAESVQQSLVGVETSLNGHQKLNSTTRDLKRRILVRKTIFLLGIRPLLAGTSAGTGDVSEHDSAVQESLQGAHIALEGIIRLLEEPEKDTEERDRVPVVVGSRIVSILRFCWSKLTAMLLPERWAQPNTEAMKPVMKNLGLMGGPQKLELKKLLVELEKNIAFLSQALELAREPAQSGTSPLRTSTLSSLSASAPHESREGFQVKSNRVILDHLYHALSTRISCRCHFIHLCLCSASAGHWDPTLQLSIGPGSICSLFITHGLEALIEGYDAEPPRHLFVSVSGSESGNGDGMPTPSHTGCSPPPCSNIVTDPIGSCHSLVHTGPTRSKFLLKSTRLPACSPNSGALSGSRPSTLQPIVTLRELLESHSQGEGSVNLVERDRFLLAAKLAQWVFQHYGTPWLHGLNAREIRFFTRYESDLTRNYANWTPYVSATFNGSPAEHNKGLYNLGLVLLELGLKEPLTNTRNNVLKAALRQLSTDLGKWYKEVVEELLLEGGSGGSIGDQLIKDLEMRIKSMKEKALEFFPE